MFLKPAGERGEDRKAGSKSLTSEFWAEVLTDCQRGAAQLKAEGESVRIWVNDTGIGIPEMMLPLVYDMFCACYRAGFGRKVVDRMDGRVGEESEVGRKEPLKLKPDDPTAAR